MPENEIKVLSSQDLPPPKRERRVAYGKHPEGIRRIHQRAGTSQQRWGRIVINMEVIPMTVNNSYPEGPLFYNPPAPIIPKYHARINLPLGETLSKAALNSLQIFKKSLPS